MRIAVIGSGLAGATIADRLKARCEVTVFERGPEGGAAPTDVELVGHQTGMDPLFYYGLGGTTNLWAGGLIDLIEREFERDWPETVWASLSGHYQTVMRALCGQQAAVDWETRQLKPLAPNAVLTSLYYGGAFRVAGSSMLDGCDVRTERHVNAVRESADTVDVIYNRRGQQEAESFDLAVVAAGGINSALLLQRSGLSNPNIGNNCTDHPMGFVAKVAKVRNLRLLETLRTPGYEGSYSNAMIKIQDRASGLHSGFYLRAAAHGRLDTDPYARSFKVLAERNKWRRIYAAVSQFHDSDFRNQALEQRWNLRAPSPFAYVLVVNEQEATGQGTIAMNEGVARRVWQVSSNVTAAIQRNLSALKDILDCDMTVAAAPLERRLYAAAHLSGSCRIAVDPNEGAVDTDLRVHGCQRTFVCDGSVLPSTGASNTGLTIAALSNRLAAHLISML